MPGEHVLVSTTLSGITLKIHILQVMSSNLYNSVDTVAFGITIGTETLVVAMTTVSQTAIWLDGQEVVIGDSITFAAGATCTRVSLYHYRIESSGEMKIDIYIYEGNLDVRVRMTSAVCSTATGLLGNCDGTATNDFVTSTGTQLTTTIGGTLSQSEIHSTFGPSWLANTADSMFSGLINIPSGPGRGLLIDMSHAISEPISTFTESQVSIEVKVKLSTVGSTCQTVWSYKKDDNDFSLLVCDGVVSIYYKNLLSKFTSLRISANTWYNLALTWQIQTRTINLFTFDESLNSESALVILSISDPNPFKPGGRIMIGQWNYPQSSRAGMFWNLIGYVDDFRIWRKQLSATEIRTYSFTHLSSSVQKLSNHWRFNSAESDKFTDSVTGLLMISYSSPWPRPKLALLDYTLTGLDTSVYTLYTSGYTYAQAYVSLCQSVIYSSHYTSACSALGNQVLDMYYR